MLQIVGKEADQWLSLEDIENFPCEELRAIDKLWVDYSKGKFGFFVQKKVWMECGGVLGKYDYDVYKKFADQVGWPVPTWPTSSRANMTHNDLAGSKQANLPSILPIDCYDLYLGVEGMITPELTWMGISFLAQRLVTCNISQT